MTGLEGAGQSTVGRLRHPFIQCSVTRQPADLPAAATLRLSPFVGMRYNASVVGDVGEVTSPPYDVMDRSMIESLLNGHPRNIVRLILPRLVAGPMTTDDPYTRAARLLSRWREEQVLITDHTPALFAYEYGDVAHRVCGLVGALELRNYTEGVVLPHEDVIEGIVADRLAMLTAQAANLEPIMLVYDGHGETSELLARARRQRPLVDVRAEDDTFHRLWAIADTEDLQFVARHLEKRQAMIADGHHRYAAYLRHRDQQHASGSTSTSENAGLSLLIDQTQFPLLVGPIHRTIADFSFADLAAAADGSGSLTLSSEIRPDSTASQRPSRPRPLMVANGLARRTLSYVGDPALSDAQLLHEVVLPLLAVSEDRISYHHTSDQALTAARQQAGMAVLLQPSTTAEVMRTARAGRMMPRKSTSFGPKPRMGLIMRFFADDEELRCTSR